MSGIFRRNLAERRTFQENGTSGLISRGVINLLLFVVSLEFCSEYSVGFCNFCVVVALRFRIRVVKIIRISGILVKV